MKKISALFSRAGFLIIVTSALVAAAWGQPAKAEVLTNDDVIAMQQAGLSPTVIVNKIRTSKTQFDHTTKELIRLRQAGINDDVLQAMQGYSESGPTPQSASQPQSPGQTQVGIQSGPPHGQRERTVEEDDPLVPREV